MGERPTLAEAIEQRRADPEFAQRLQDRIETDADLLARLGAPQEGDDR